MGHMFLPPSGAGDWVHCPYWPTANRDNPQPDTPASIEGNCAHTVVSDMLTKGRIVEVGQPIDAGSPHLVDAEMLEGAQMYVADVLENAKGQGVYVEQKVYATSIHEDHCGGTPDAFAWVNASHLVVWDYKYGHDYVPAFQNWQLMTYVRGILDTFDIDGLQEQRLTVDMRLIQPRNYDREGHVRSWSAKASDLRAFWNILRGSADEATSPNPQARTGTHCKHCPGRHTCPTLQRAAYAQTKYAGQGQPFALSGEALGKELRRLQDSRELIDARITGLEMEAAAKIKARESVDGFTLERGLGRTYWSIPFEKIVEQGQMWGVKTQQDKAITPRQAIQAGMPEAVVASLSKRAPTEEKLVRNENTVAIKLFSRTS